ncbi:MAG: amino acid ABC transporter permease [Betaproteobacteria bacterium]|nr:amino acid ABC transporter permease [Betaproteobacteria bacterium]
MRWRLPAVACLLALATSLPGCGGTSNYEWGWYVFNPVHPKGSSNLSFMLSGLWATVSVSVAAIALSVVLGAFVALAGLARSKSLRVFNRVYVECIRAIPLLVLLLWVYYGLPILSGIQFGVFASGLLSLAVSDSAFEAEVFRAGIQSVPRGQVEAAETLGLSRAQQLWYVVMPQAVRHILPALGNQFIYVMKMSSLVSVVGFGELTRKANELNVTEYRPLEIYTFLVLEYLALILIVSWLVRRLERRLAASRH